MFAQYRSISCLITFLLIANTAQPYYAEGDTLSQSDLATPLLICSNGSESISIGGILDAQSGAPDKVILLNLFASW